MSRPLDTQSGRSRFPGYPVQKMPAKKPTINVQSKEINLSLKSKFLGDLVKILPDTLEEDFSS